MDNEKDDWEIFEEELALIERVRADFSKQIPDFAPSLEESVKSKKEAEHLLLQCKMHHRDLEHHIDKAKNAHHDIQKLYNDALADLLTFQNKVEASISQLTKQINNWPVLDRIARARVFLEQQLEQDDWNVRVLTVERTLVSLSIFERPTLTII